MAYGTAPLHSWREALLVYTQPRVVGMWFLGFSAGLPFLLVFSTLSAWLTDENVSRATIGFFSWIGITYSIKVVWAPVIDRLPFPFFTRVLGKRRGWMLIAQIGIACGLFGMAAIDPSQDLQAIALFGLLVAFSSATQDVALDAYRIEAMDKEFQGAMSAMYIFGYRTALLVAGAGAFYFADYIDWPFAYTIMVVLTGVGMLTVMVIREPQHTVTENTLEQEQHVAEILGDGKPGTWHRIKAWFASAVVSPFVDFIKRYGKFAIIILVFIGIYRISDITMGVMANPFYLDMGYSKVDIANIGKVFGFFMTILGAATGGILVVRYGIHRPLILGAVLVAATNLLFAFLATLDPDLVWLAIVISADNFSGGLAGSAFIAFLSSLTNSAYTATQYALFSSLMTLPAKILGGFSGVIVEGYGYEWFFSYAALLGTPAIAVALYLTLSTSARQQQVSAEQTSGH